MQRFRSSGLEPGTESPVPDGAQTIDIGNQAASTAQREDFDRRAGEAKLAQTAAIAELKSSVVRLLEACDSSDAADTTNCTEMRQTLRAYMHRQLAREEEWISTTPIGWW